MLHCVCAPQSQLKKTPIPTPCAGQLAGSLAAAVLARAPVLRSRPDAPSLLPLLLSAALLELAGRCALRFKPTAAAAGQGGPLLSQSFRLEAAAAGAAEAAGGADAAKAAPPRAAGVLRQTFDRMAEGYRLIRWALLFLFRWPHAACARPANNLLPLSIHCLPA